MGFRCLIGRMSLDGLKVIVHVLHIHIDSILHEFHQRWAMFGPSQDHDWSWKSSRFTLKDLTWPELSDLYIWRPKTSTVLPAQVNVLQLGYKSVCLKGRIARLIRDSHHDTWSSFGPLFESKLDICLSKKRYSPYLKNLRMSQHSWAPPVFLACFHFLWWFSRACFRQIAAQTTHQKRTAKKTSSPASTDLWWQIFVHHLEVAPWPSSNWSARLAK